MSSAITACSTNRRASCSSLDSHHPRRTDGTDTDGSDMEFIGDDEADQHTVGRRHEDMIEPVATKLANHLVDTLSGRMVPGAGIMTSTTAVSDGSADAVGLTAREERRRR